MKNKKHLKLRSSMHAILWLSNQRENKENKNYKFPFHSDSAFCSQTYIYAQGCYLEGIFYI